MALLDSIFGIFKGHEQSVLGIDIGSSAIKVVQIKKKKGRAVLETYGELAIGPYGGIEIGRAANLPGEKIVEALNDLMREANVTTKSVGLAIPISSSLITFITVPTVDQKQLPEMISLEARKYIPVPINEVLLDWSIIPHDDEISDEVETDAVESQGTGASAASAPSLNTGTSFAPTFGAQAPAAAPKKVQNSEVLVVAIHNEAMNGFQALMTKANLQASFYEIELFSCVRAVLEQGIQAQMIMDMGASSTKLYIIERGILRNSHIVNRGSQDITLAISKSMSIAVNEAENMKRVYGLSGGAEYKELAEIISLNLDYIFYESNRVLLNFQKHNNKTVSRVILTGGGVLMKGFAELAQSSFQTEVVYADPFAKLETPAFLSEQLTTAGPEFAVAIGAALRRLSEVQ